MNNQCSLVLQHKIIIIIIIITTISMAQ